VGYGWVGGYGEEVWRWGVSVGVGVGVGVGVVWSVSATEAQCNLGNSGSWLKGGRVEVRNRHALALRVGRHRPCS
jgi:hypothetical protein